MAVRSVPNASTSATAGQRWRHVGAGAVALMTARVITAACGLIQIRVVLGHLGPAGLGLWITLTGLVWSAGILDGGIGFAVQNRLTAHFAAGNEQAAGALLHRAYRRLRLIGAGVLVLGLVVVGCLPWSRWLPTDLALHRDLPMAIGIVVVAAALLIPVSLVSRLAAARQAMWITGIWTAGSSLLGLIAVMMAGGLGSSLAGFTAAGCILPLLPHVLTWIHLRRQIPLADHAEPYPMTAVWKESALFLMPQVGAAFISSLVPSLVTIFAGPIAAASFGVLQRLYGFALQIQSMGLAPTWPAYTHAGAVGDAAFARRTFRTTGLLTAFGFILPVVVLTPFAPALIRLWLGSNAPDVPAALLWTTSIWYVLQFCGQPIAMLLNGLGRMGTLAVIGWIGIAASLGLCAWWGPRWGATGVVVALLIPYAVLNLPVTGWRAHRTLRALAQSTPPAP